MFSSKTLTIIGGTGYIGSSLARSAVALGFKVNAISRKGYPLNTNPNDSKINWIKGSAMNPEGIIGALKESDAVVHSVGVLIDAAIMGRAKPGEMGTYEQMNRDTAIKIADALEKIGDGKKRKIIYLSANKIPPPLHRYMEAKREAESHLLSLSHTIPIILRPGFVYSSEKSWSLFLQPIMKINNKIQRSLIEALKNGKVHDFLKKWESDDPIALNDVVDCILYASVENSLDQKIVLGEDMIRKAQEWREKHKMKSYKSLHHVGKYFIFPISQAIYIQKVLPRVFIDIKFEDKVNKERIVAELYEHLVPKTTENFLKLILGSYKGKTGSLLSYKNTQFHRVFPGFAIQGGDVVKKDGTGGGESIYGEKFNDESFAVLHEKEGILTMVNNGPNTNQSQFLITLGPSTWLDHKNVAFGEIIHGLDVLGEIEKYGSSNGKTAKKIWIEECGLVNEKDYHRYDKHHHHNVLEHH